MVITKANNDNNRKLEQKAIQKSKKIMHILVLIIHNYSN